MLQKLKLLTLIFTIFTFKLQANKALPPKIEVKKGMHISMIGGNMGSRMMNYGLFETELHLRYPSSQLFIRNMCDGGDTPGFRPRSSRFNPWAFPGADKYQGELKKITDTEGSFESADEWLTRLKSDLVIGFFGFSESQAGPAGLAKFKAELNAFLVHSKDQGYNENYDTKFVLVSPTAMEDLSAKYDIPNGKKTNINLQLYTLAMKEIAAKHKVTFVDAYTPSTKWYTQSTEDLTIDGVQLNELGYAKLAKLLSDEIFGAIKSQNETNRTLVNKMVNEKNWMWHNDYKIPNGVHVYGRRYNPFGPDNYPFEITKIREMTDIRDRAIWLAAETGQALNLDEEDAKTSKLPEVVSNFDPAKNGNAKYLYGEEAINSFTMAPGYKVELFASEREFADLANPVQMTFDTKGRLWVATMPSYPHYKPGDSKPNDKLIILEDTNNDGKADKQSVFADGLHLPLGFEITKEGVYVSQGTNLVLLKDTNNDGKCDKQEIVLSGFDDHDTHHNSHSFTSDPSGAIYTGEGIFLLSNVEGPYGTMRASNGGFYRYSPQLKKLERTSQIAIPNPWGIAFDDWGQPFYAETSNPDVHWMMPTTTLPRYGEVADKSAQLIEEAHRVRPTSGLEFLHSRHFPDDVQGNMLINNTIGFLGMKAHNMKDDGTGYKSTHNKDIIVSADRNFRPVDMEIAPDGSLYVIDWHNVLIGHMQHNARDPYRDHVHGRVYRITYPGRPLLTPAQIDGASVETLLNNLKEPEFRTRYRTRAELRNRDAADVLPKIKSWIAALDKTDPRYEHHMLEGLWVSWGFNKVDQDLLKQVLNAKDYHARAAAVDVVRHNGHQLKDQATLLMKAAKDPHGRVRLAALVAASWLNPLVGVPIINQAKQLPVDSWIKEPLATASHHIVGKDVNKVKEVAPTSALKGEGLQLFLKGREIYAKEGYCITCHQPNGLGLEAAGFPSLAGNNWVNGNEDRLIKLVLKGLIGPIEVKGKTYPGHVPMTGFGGLLNDKEMASVLTYVRNNFGNSNAEKLITPERVKAVRASIANKKDYFTSADLLKEYPMEQ